MRYICIAYVCFPMVCHKNTKWKHPLCIKHKHISGKNIKELTVAFYSEREAN